MHSWMWYKFTPGTRLFYRNKFNGEVEYVTVVARYDESFELSYKGKTKHISFERARDCLFTDIQDAPWYPEYLERCNKAEENYSYSPSFDTSVVFGD